MNARDLRYLRQYNPAKLDPELIEKTQGLMARMSATDSIRELRKKGYPFFAALAAVWAVKDADK